MKFSQLEFRQKRLNHRIRAILEAIEPELNSFGRLADLFLTAGAELRESALSAISRAVNEKTLYEIRNLELQIAEIDSVIRGKRDEIREKSLDIQTQRTDPQTKWQQADFDAAEQEILAWEKEISAQEQLKTPLVKKNSDMRKTYFSVTAQNSIFRAAFTRLEKCAEELGYPTAKTGLSTALYGANYKEALNALGKKTAATPQAKAKKQYAPSPPPIAPIMAQVAQQAIGKAVGQPAQQNAPAPAPTPGAAQTPAQAGPQIKRTGKKNTILLPNGNQIPLGPATPQAQQAATPAAAPPAQATPAAQAPTPAVQPPAQTAPPAQATPPTQVAAPAQSKKTTSQSPIDSLMSIGDKLQDQNAKKYLAALVTWFKNAVAQANLSGKEGAIPNSKGLSWLLAEYVKIVRDQIEMGLVRADANMQNEEYRKEIDPEIFDPKAFTGPVPMPLPFNDKFVASLRASGTAKFGSFELDDQALRLRFAFDNDFWPVISSESNRLAAESQTFFRPEDVQQIKKVIQEAQAQNIPLEERLKGVADEKGMDPKQIAGLATLVQVSLPEEAAAEVAPEVTPEVVQEPLSGGVQKVMPGEPFSEQDVVEFLRNSKKTGIKRLEDLQPVVQRYVDSLGTVSTDDSAIDAAQKEIGNAVVHSKRTGELYDIADSAVKVIMANRTAFKSMIAQAMMSRMPEKTEEPSATPAGEPAIGGDVTGQVPETPVSSEPAPGSSAPREQLPPITKKDIAEFLATTKITQMADLVPLISRAAAGVGANETDAAKTVAASVNLGIGFVSKLGKSPAKENAAVAVGLIAKDRGGFIKMVEDEIANPSAAAPTTNTEEPVGAPVGPLGLSQVIQKGVESLRALETAEAQSVRALAGSNLKAPDVVGGEAAELLQTLKTGGLNAMLSSVPKYLKQ